MHNLINAIRQGQDKPSNEPPKPVEKQPLTELSLIKEITESMSIKSKVRGYRPGIHPSEISYEDPFCPRWHVFRDSLVKAQQNGNPLPFGLNKKKADEPPNPELMRIFQMGHSIHAMYQDDILGPAGVLYGFWKRWNNKKEKWETDRGFRPQGDGWKYEEPRVRSKGVTGQCDGIVKVDDRWLALEIKSSNDKAFQFRKKPKHEHVRQAQVYANLGFVDFPEIDVEGIIFLYVNKNTSVEREWIVPKDSSVIKDILDGIQIYTESVKTKKLPKRQCIRAKCKRANACPVSVACFKIGEGEAAFVEVMNP